jgi:hypothetical protein
MNQRILLAALLGGLALFAWESVAHLMTPLGEMGFKTLDDEATVLPVLKTTVHDSGFYFFPAPQYRAGMSSAEKSAAMDAAMQKYQQGPSGMILILRNGATAMTPQQLLTQFVADLVAMLIAAILLAQLGPGVSFARKLSLFALLALFPTLRMGVPWVNWYHFPNSLFAAQFIVDFAGFLIAGLIVAKLVQSRSKTMAAAS